MAMFMGTIRIYMDKSTIEFGRECLDCLRWFVPLNAVDKCPHCFKYGRPSNPNRVRYLAVKNGISLREISRKADVSWRTMRLVAQGKISPRKTTVRKILKAMGVPLRKAEVLYVFPFLR